MSTGTGIEWTDATWNPVVGCTRASAGCDNCYAVTMTHRLEAMGQAKYRGLTVLNRNGDRHFNGVVRCVEEDLEIPLRWKKPRRAFVNSMSDLFHKDVPFEFIVKVFATMACCSRHTFQILTKRPEYMAECAARLGKSIEPLEAAAREMGYTLKFNGIGLVPWPLRNVWLGTSIENRDVLHRADELRKCPAAIRFLSLEPLIGDLGKIDLSGIGWVIVGGESGTGSRQCEELWILSIIEQCRAADVACFVKQLGRNVIGRTPGGNRIGWFPRDQKGGDMAEWNEDLRVRQFPRQPTEATR